jgi:hypothetical protein
MAPTRPRDARTKFEEDIKVPFVSLYSFSTTVPDPARTFRTLRDVARLFPDIPHRIGKVRDDEALAVVKGFTAHERVIVGASLRIGKSPRLAAAASPTRRADLHRYPAPAHLRARIVEPRACLLPRSSKASARPPTPAPSMLRGGTGGTLEAWIA